MSEKLKQRDELKRARARMRRTPAHEQLRQAREEMEREEMEREGKVLCRTPIALAAVGYRGGFTTPVHGDVFVYRGMDV